MDDPRSPRTAFITNEDFQRCKPLTALARNDLTLDEWLKSLKKSAKYLENDGPEPSKIAQE